MNDVRLTETQIASRAVDLCETLRAIDAENQDFADLRATHRAAIEKLETRASRLRREIETGTPEEVQTTFADVADEELGADTPSGPDPGDIPLNDHEEARAEGRVAYEAGLAETECPYDARDLSPEVQAKRRAWIGGWNDADSEADVEGVDEGGITEDVRGEDE